MDPISYYADVMGRSTSRPGYLETESSVMSALSRGLSHTIFNLFVYLADLTEFHLSFSVQI